MADDQFDNEFHRTIVENLADGVYFVDPGRKIPLDVNLINNVRTVPPPVGPVWKYAVKVLFWIQNMFLFAATIA